VNVVCGETGHAEAVLLRAAEPLEGLAEMRRRRKLAPDASDLEIARGPGRLAQALGLDLDIDGRILLRGSLTLHPPATEARRLAIESGPRVGITKAAKLPYRFFEAASPWVSKFRAGSKR